VRKASAEEVARYKPQAKRALKDPLFTVQAGDITLLVEYDMQANTIPFVGQIGVAYQAPRPAAPPVVEQRSAPAVAAIPAKPAVARRAPPAAPAAEALKPNGPCVVTPVMSEQDLANCRGAPGGAARVPPGPPIVVKPQARVAPPPAAAPSRVAPCEVKPVMSEEDLANCRAAPGGAARVQPGPPIVAKPQPAVKPEASQRTTGPCVVKPVMSEEDLANCRAAPGGAARVQPGPPIVVKPQAVTRPETSPAPQRAGPCEIKAVMSEEDLANCRAAPGGAARVQPGPPVAPRAPTAAAAGPERKPPTPCVIKPVMTEEDRIACGIGSR
ncbi:MAG TPA: hypothetical protein VM140_08590, partial [Burkholderiales bacterium]|nr:hypothetical protein [Burkholderiales bacterium]